MLVPYASGSSGNLYEVWDGETRLLLECGLRYKQMQEACRRPMTDYAAFLLTHEHKDHSKSALELLSRGVDGYMTPGTAQAIGAKGARLHEVDPGRQFSLGSYAVKAFPTAHDCAQPCGYLIHSITSGERLCFATDTAYIGYRFPGLTEIAVECNYSQEGLAESVLPQIVKDRVQRTHMALEQVEDWLTGCDLSRVSKIWLLHLSGTHGRAGVFKEQIRAATGIDTEVC